MDWTLFHAVNRFAAHTSWLHGAMKAYAEYGIALFVVLLAVAGVNAVRSGNAAQLAHTAWAAVGAMIVLGVNQPIADAFGRARPYASHANVLRLVDRTVDPSFMSDHSLVTMAVAVGLFFVSRRLGLVAFVAAVVMAFARVYVGAHYPGDVVAGAAFAAVVVVSVHPLVDRYVAPIAGSLLAQPWLGRWARDPA